MTWVEAASAGQQGSRASALGHTGYLPGVDGLRAIAVLSVMLFHLQPGWLPGGFVGVDVFFVISGYVVTASLLRHRDEGFRPFVLGFYARRFKRILPAALVCLTATSVFVVAFVPTSWLSSAVRDTGLWAYLGLSNFVLANAADGYFAPRTEFNPYTHTWSLAVEEQFYLVYPLLVWAWLKLQLRPGGARAMNGVFGLLLLASFVWCALATYSAPSQAYYMLAARWWELAAGGALSLLVAGGAGRHVPARFAVPLGIALVALAALLADKGRFPFPWAVPAVCGSLLVIAGLAAADVGSSRAGRWLASAPLVAIGLRSYSLYLWHWPVYAAFRWTVGFERPTHWLLAVLITFVLSWLSYAHVEQPVQRGRRVAAAPRWAVVAVALGSVGLVWAAAWQLYAHQGALSLSVVVRDAAAWSPTPSPAVQTLDAANCGVRLSRDRVRDEVVETMSARDCQRGPESAARLYVVGDSHASAYRRMFNLLTASTGITVVIYTRAGCAVAAMLEPASAQTPDCREFERWALAEVQRQMRPGDLIFLPALRIERLGEPYAILDVAAEPDDVERARAAERMQRARTEAQVVLARLVAAGAQVLIDAPKPVFRSPAFRCADWFNASNPVCDGGRGLSVPRAFIESRRSAVVAGLQQLSTAVPGVHVWDPLPLLCPEPTCQAMRGDRPLFFDGDHLSGYANEMLLPDFRRLVRSLLPPA